MKPSMINRVRALSASKLAAKLQKRLAQQEHDNFLQKNLPEPDKSQKMESMLAGVFLRDNASTFDSYQRHLDKINESNKAKLKKSKENPSNKESIFPYQAEHLTEIIDKSKEIAPPESKPTIVGIDRGFFVKGDKYCDEFMAGTTASIPEDEQNECPYIYYGTDDAIEHIEMMQPYQEAQPKKRKESTGNSFDVIEQEQDEGDWSINYGKEDQHFKIETHIECSGCGAKLHCHDNALPGFMPVELLQKTLKKHKQHKHEQLNELCRRCYMLKHHDFLLNINVSSVDYTALMGHLKLVHEALILLVVDMTDIRGSIHQQLPSIIGDKKPMIVIGNKTDLLPPDARPGFFKNFRDILQKEIEMAGFSDRFNILGTVMVSAKNGFGVEDLISMIYLNWMNIKGTLRGNIYVVGCTNAGKSTLFNTFLQSDLCKVRAIDLVERVTTSVWPGTTLSLLKFPVLTLTARRLELRRRRLLANKALVKKEARFQRALFEQSNDPKFLSLIGHVESTFHDTEIASQPLTKEENQRVFEGEDLTEIQRNKVKAASLDEHDFTTGFWCYDTPGTVNKQQILDLLTLDELIRVIPHSLILPRTVVCNAGDSLLIGGLAQVDIVEVFEKLEGNIDKYGNRPVYLTVFASKQLPLHVVKTKSVEKFLHNRLGTDILGAPLGDKERLAKLPPLRSETYTIMTKDQSFLKGSADILLSSVGWVLVSSQFNAKIKAYTPDGRGIGKRESILPHAVELKGARIPGTQFYKVKLTTPEIEQKKHRFKRK